MPKLQLLVQLARIDGEISPEEVDLIYKVGRAEGFLDEEILRHLQRLESSEVNFNLSADEKFDTLYDLVHLMKADGKLFPQEIKFCARVAGALDYRKEVVFELLTKLSEKKSRPEIKKEVNHFLKSS